MKSTQNKIKSPFFTQFREEKSHHLRFSDLSGKLDNISQQFNEILTKNKSIETKIEQLENKLSKYWNLISYPLNYIKSVKNIC